MAMAKSLVFFVFFFLIFSGTTPTELSDSEGEVSYVAEVSDASLRVELDELKSKISSIGLVSDLFFVCLNSFVVQEWNFSGFFLFPFKYAYLVAVDYLPNSCLRVPNFIECLYFCR